MTTRGKRSGGYSPFVDFHTHETNCKAYAGRTDVIAVQSVMYGLDEPSPEADYVTIGIHPMQDDVERLMRHLVTDPDALRGDMEAKISELGGRCCGIGECGWDRRSILSWDEQDALMAFHYALARDLHLPLVLHIVGGMHRLLALKSCVIDDRVRWYYHGFRGKPAALKQILSAGVHVSLSPDGYTSKEVMGQCMATSFFLETDDSNRSIEEVYLKTSDLLNIDMSELCDRLYGDFKIFLSK